MPSRIVKHEQGDPCHARFGLARKGFEQSLEEFLRRSVRNIFDAPLETYQRVSPVAGDTNAARPWRRPRPAFRGALPPPRRGHPRAFLNAAASSGVADFGFFGRGFWIDQPIQNLRFQDCCRCAVAAAQVAQSLRPLGIVTGARLFDPPLAEGCRRRHLRDGVTARQKPDRLEMPRRRGS